MIINIRHKKMTHKESIENIRRLHKKYPDIIISVKEYRKLMKEK
jgi:hypothetical protein